MACSARLAIEAEKFCFVIGHMFVSVDLSSGWRYLEVMAFKIWSRQSFQPMSKLR